MFNIEKLEFNSIRDHLSKFTHTFEGKKLACILEPSSKSMQVQSMLNETNECLKAINIKGELPISEINDVSLYIKNLKSSLSLSSKGLLEICNILRTSREITEYFKDLEESLPSLEDYYSMLYINKDVENKIAKCVISEDEIADSASTKLCSIRTSKKSLESNIKNKLNQVIRANSKYIMDPVITIRDGRFVIPVKDEYRSFVKGFIHDTSSSGSTVYIEPMAVFEINNKINSLIIEENKEIERILSELSSLLYPIVYNIEQDVKVISKLDLINAKAKLAIEMDGNLPILSDNINLIKARHPLISKDKVVPIDMLEKILKL